MRYFILSLTLLLFTCQTNSTNSIMEKKSSDQLEKNASILPKIKIEETTLGAGCFWCIEAIFENLDGVVSVSSGYTGGRVKNPTYEAVCSGKTGHAEVARIVFDPKKLSFAEILDVFWGTHDPTTLNKQGNDEGTQYRSAIFYHNKEQKEIAEKSIKEAAKIFDEPIVTEITALGTYYKAENYHQDYFKRNPNQPYCTFVIKPKMAKFRKQFQDKLKKN